MLRLLLPSIMELFGALTLIWFLCFIIMNYVIVYIDETERKNVLSVATIVSLITIVGFIIYMVNIASVNEIPRAELDRSGMEQGQSNFQDRMDKDANQTKIIDTTKIK